MCVGPADSEILRGLYELKKAYREKFGEGFIHFNYEDFRATEEKCAGQVYKETLEKALKDDKPYHIVSRRWNEWEH